MRTLILCAGNSWRSQIAHGFLQSFDSNINVFSAGANPTGKTNTMEVKVMFEISIGLSCHTPEM